MVVPALLLLQLKRILETRFADGRPTPSGGPSDEALQKYRDHGAGKRSLRPGLKALVVRGR